MQSDEQLDELVRQSDHWKNDPVSGRKNAQLNRYELTREQKGKMSLSGNERNHLFFNDRGQRFADISAISGLDSPQDSRSLAICDYDRDGWQDIVLANTNTPVLNLYRNQVGSMSDHALGQGKMVALRFVGGNDSSQPSRIHSCRDGYGVKATVSLPDKTLIREHRCGEGLAAQNSRVMLIGIGNHETVDSIRIQWPSGITQQIENTPAGDLLTVYELASESADGSGFDRSRYLIDRLAPTEPVHSRMTSDIQFLQPADQPADVCIYTSMATWCAACREHLPDLRRIRNRFNKQQVRMVGVPIDANDTQDQLDRFIRENQPDYVLDSRWNRAQIDNFNRITLNQLGSRMIPATIIVSNEGVVLDVIAGIPTVSDVARQLGGK